MVSESLRKICGRRRRDENQEIKQRLPVTQKISHGVGHILNDLAASVWFSYLIIYLTKVAGLPNRHTGLVVLLGQVADAVCTPFVGILCDRTVCRYGRRKIWHLVGCVLTSLSFPLLFIRLLPVDSSPTTKVCYYVGIAAVFQFGWGSVQISHLTLIPEISKRSSERVELNAIRSALTFLCGIFVYGVTWILLGESSDESLSPSVWKQFMYLSFIIVGCGNVFNVIFHVFTKEPPSEALLKWKEEQQQTKAALEKPHCNGKKDSRVVYTESSNSPSRRSGASPQVVTALCDSKHSNHSNGDVTGITDNNANYSEQAPLVSGNEDGRDKELDIVELKEPVVRPSGKTKKQWLKDPNLYKVGLMYMCTRIVVNISQSYLPLYLTDTMDFNKEAIAYFPLVVLTSGVVASVIVKPLNKKLGNKATFSLGSLLALCACAWFYIQPVASRNAIYAATIVMGCGGSVMLVSALSLIAHLVGNDNQSGAFIYGAISFTDKLSSGAVIAIIQELNPRKSPGSACSTCAGYVRYIQSLAPGIAALLALFITLVFYEPFFECRRRVVRFDKEMQTEPDEDVDFENMVIHDDNAEFINVENEVNEERGSTSRSSVSSVESCEEQKEHEPSIWEKQPQLEILERLSGKRSRKSKPQATQESSDKYSAFRLASSCVPSPELERRTIV